MENDLSIFQGPIESVTTPDSVSLSSLSHAGSNHSQKSPATKSPQMVRNKTIRNKKLQLISRVFHPNQKKTLADLFESFLMFFFSILQFTRSRTWRLRRRRRSSPPWCGIQWVSGSQSPEVKVLNPTSKDQNPFLSQKSQKEDPPHGMENFKSGIVLFR